MCKRYPTENPDEGRNHRRHQPSESGDSLGRATVRHVPRDRECNDRAEDHQSPKQGRDSAYG